MYGRPAVKGLRGRRVVPVYYVWNRSSIKEVLGLVRLSQRRHTYTEVGAIIHIQQRQQQTAQASAKLHPEEPSKQTHARLFDLGA